MLSAILLGPLVLSAVGRLKIRVCMTDFACGVYDCETWSLSLREDHRLRVFENMVTTSLWSWNEPL
jgi:hypothetical protein